MFFFQAKAPSQASARHTRANGTAAVLAPQGLSTGHTQAPQQLPPVQPNVRSGQEQPAQQIYEAYDLNTFLKERDACGVSPAAAGCTALQIKLDLSEPVIHKLSFVGGVHSQP